ncbi:60S ribosomal protein L12 (nucleomorph) [Chroomonas mesostigmatica CCMP1168]|uniref:60S ribosomal protein L12 n=1 Tax=Chroomonas mesostigmatica CCMP1168 TaxID=1195612 RepID=J7GA27_9CRYP|nr:60S ribosomal protein L12 [Chroomonas mesostigmatica CCMP1168]|mmetsp:Transcript_65869/g.162142  ORF Transcript_65869/g.162142 Transcript_65869/m.162142 type:complete len:157 (+) Transcript_65869:891-1361(+)
MAPKFNPEAITIIFIRTIGGEIGSVSSLAPKLGPLGLSPKKIGEQLSNATKDWEGLRVSCKLKIQNRQTEVEVVPSAAALILKGLKEPKRDRKKIKNIKHEGNLSLSYTIEVAKKLKERSLSIDLKGNIKEILGTARSIGCTINKKKPNEIDVNKV